MIILLSSQKGGVGKTTLATNIAVELLSRGFTTVLIDSDSQRSASQWSADRDESGAEPSVLAMYKDGNLFQSLQELDKNYNYVVVDLPGKDSQEQRTALSCAHIAVTPCQPSQFDADTLPRLLAVADEARNFNPELKVKAVITRASTNPQVKDADEVAEYIGGLSGIELLESRIYDRKAYKAAASEGLAVTEGPARTHGAAAEEVRNLLNEILES